MKVQCAGRVSAAATESYLPPADGDAALHGPGADHSMLQALCAQRNRLRARAQKLQDELTESTARAARAEAAVETARAENLALVERLRYVQTFACAPLPVRYLPTELVYVACACVQLSLCSLTCRAVSMRSALGSSSTLLGNLHRGSCPHQRRRGACRARSGGSAGAAQLARGEVGRRTVDKYASQYERQLDPFQEFKGQAREARRARMHTADRALLQIGGMMAGSALLRLMVVIYLLAMHLLVLVVLLRSAHHRSAHLHVHEWAHLRDGETVQHSALATSVGGHT